MIHIKLIQKTAKKYLVKRVILDLPSSKYFMDEIIKLYKTRKATIEIPITKLSEIPRVKIEVSESTNPKTKCFTLYAIDIKDLYNDIIKIQEEKKEEV